MAPLRRIGLQDNAGNEWADGIEGISGTSAKSLTTPFGGVLGAMMAYIPGIRKEEILVKLGGEDYVAGVVDSGHNIVFCPLSILPSSTSWRAKYVTRTLLGFNG